jgi:8-oxo-dGTP diphosphatase
MQEEQIKRIIVARTLVFREGQVLLVGHRSPSTGRVWWMAPGGTVAPRETVMDAAAREVKEETGLDVAIKRLVYWLEWVWERSYCLEFYFLGEVTCGALIVGSDPEFGDGQQLIFDARFFDLDELQDFPVHPKVFRTMLPEHWREGFPAGAMYLGVDKPDLPRQGSSKGYL